MRRFSGFFIAIPWLSLYGEQFVCQLENSDTEGLHNTVHIAGIAPNEAVPVLTCKGLKMDPPFPAKDIERPGEFEPSAIQGI
jgi:hypothetical protein